MNLDLIRGIVRPILTLSGWGVLLYLAVFQDGDIRKTAIDAVMMMVAFWFGQRNR